MKKAIVVGASSGIGHQLAVLLAANNYKVGITGRRDQLLLNLQSTNPAHFIVSVFDATDVAGIPQYLNQLTKELGGLDLLVLSSGTGKINEVLDGRIEQDTNALNVAGFTEIADWAFKFFQEQAFGHFVGITSIAGLRGSGQAPAYFASKAYQISYLEGLRQKAKHTKLPIYITDIRPGFVDTAMAGGENLFWVAPVEKAAAQIYKAIEDKKNVAYVTRRWRLIGFLFWILPGFIHKRL
ncbi:SDR family NAD(P)-dependent oxidoreductase [Mucilaginibacter sp. L3T2-6]|uniref:SDR family NAD(P)-dependent oxidoreductase n=1 Tax=Mucilaginibacter sp. L3T2-6 TaxID=3062491 RepID=UPI0026774927|nr:SDR family NAD(P)-dependent oxidoreductase [Mucilaginibacter sp. L3T2-6]MDO3644255.1 SDR family NAD(P)-dependent oxidoreductase [Mucilaginibacter sp. L3T2-6]MDV6216648.1 SDR family NAD(P)-dependent oxidoreductase [Mucilaginibacter sp. L3T2-6]